MEYFLQILHGPAVNRRGVHFRGVFTGPDPSRLVATSATSQTSPAAPALNWQFFSAFISSYASLGGLGEST